MPYTHIRFLSYAVPTFYPTPPGTVAAASGARAIAIDDPDLQARVQRFLNVLSWTQAQLAAGPPPSAGTLTVFMAPQLYFREGTRPGDDDGTSSLGAFYGSYPMAYGQAVANALYQATQDGDAFSDWTVVAGSTSGLDDAHDDPDLRTLNDQGILVRGPRSSEDGAVPALLVDRRAVQRQGIQPVPWSAHLTPPGAFTRLGTSPEALGALIRWDGITLGVEGFLEHGAGLVAGGMAQLREALGPHAGSIDLHLVSSCGMDLIPHHVAVESGSLVLLCDGMARSLSGCGTPTTRMARFRPGPRGVTLEEIHDRTFLALPDDPDHRVAYPGYAGEQGVFVYNAVPLHAPG